MTNETTQALADAGLLLSAFVASPWRSLDVASGSMRLTISRLSPTGRSEAGFQASDSVTAYSEAGQRRLTAPHVATLRDLAAVGSTVRAGEPYATLEVLDELITLRAPEDMTPLTLLSRPGALLEFGSPLMTMQAAGSEPRR